QGGLYESSVESPFGFEFGFYDDLDRFGPKAAHDMFGGQASVQGTDYPAWDDERRRLRRRVCPVHEVGHFYGSYDAHQLAGNQEVEDLSAPTSRRSQQNFVSAQCLRTDCQRKNIVNVMEAVDHQTPGSAALRDI